MITLRIPKIPYEHRDQVEESLMVEWFENTKIAMIALAGAWLAYCTLVYFELGIKRFAAIIAVQWCLAGATFAYIFWLAKFVKNRKTRLAFADIVSGFTLLSAGIGFYLQLPQMKNIGMQIIAYSICVGVLGAAAFAYAPSKRSFLIFAIGWAGPLEIYLFFQSPETSYRFFGITQIVYVGILYVTARLDYIRRVQHILSELALANTRNKLQSEFEKSEKLLLNILPASVADELKIKGHAEPELFPSATVLFTDFVGFTRIAENLSPHELVAELGNCFSYFDAVTQRFGLEKLKTIGDAYMAAGGVPIANHVHAIDCALAALEIQAFMDRVKKTKEQNGMAYWELRLGMHTGTLVAGVVGDKKFAYDVWGDTVNTASRMESSGEPGRINISEATYQQVRFLFDCEPRGRIEAKNKGEIHMYFLYRIRKKYSADEEGRVPNDAFRAIYERIAAGARLVPRSAN